VKILQITKHSANCRPVLLRSNGMSAFMIKQRVKKSGKMCATLKENLWNVRDELRQVEKNSLRKTSKRAKLRKIHSEKTSATSFLQKSRRTLRL
jgi:hypothetical protein